MSSIHQFNEGSHRTEGFRDAFDGEGYDKKVWSMVGGNERVVKVS
jgi:ABC-type sugar transport system substrate-binding protein